MNTNEIITSSVLAYVNGRLKGLERVKAFRMRSECDPSGIEARIDELERIKTLCEGLEQQLSLMKENIEKVLNHTGELK